jgi:hypothetical protein
MVLVLGLAAAEGVDDLEAGDVDVYETKSGEGSPERGLIPQALETRRK